MTYKYYLYDVTYQNTQGFRYWLGDYHHRRTINKKEKFKHGDAQPRNIIERAYGGVLKQDFLYWTTCLHFSN